jgi:uncharacterized membrane protein
MKSRLFKAASWQDVILFLLPIMIVSLLLTVVAGTAALVWDGQPIGEKVATVADVFAWLFAAAFSAAFLLAVLREQRKR